MVRRRSPPRAVALTGVVRRSRPTAGRRGRELARRRRRQPADRPSSATPRLEPDGADVRADGPAARRRDRHPGKARQRADIAADTIRASLSAAGLLTVRPGGPAARPCVLVLLARERGPGRRSRALADAGDPHRAGHGAAGTTPRGWSWLGDAVSGDDGLLADLREDALVTSTLATVDGGDTAHRPGDRDAGPDQASLDGSVGAYGASGSDGVVPIS